MTDKQIFLDTALKIVDRIVKNTVWDNDKCTWKIYAPDLANPKERTGIWENAGGTVYQGTAGIALLLAEIFRITGDRKYLKTLMGAVNNSLFELEKIPLNSFGFHGGRVGIAYASILTGNYIGNEDFIKKGLGIIEPMLGKESEDYGIDVIGGAGGAIQPLLKIYEITDDQNVLNVAMNLGESLISKANMEPHGWSWGGGNSNYRNLCGYAHGASGIGHAFLELYNLSNSNYYLYAAEQSFIYERQFFDEEVNNWPDFRYSELSEYTHYNRIKELKEALKKNELIPYSIKYMSAWCHGAPGIGLSRLRGYELTGNDLYKRESIAVCKNTAKGLELLNNYSLCHGLFGNAETLLFGSSILSEKKYLDLVREKAVEGIEKFENKNIPWPCGTMNSTSDPSLMVGESGIGYFLLRLYDEKTPSLLAIKSNRNNKYVQKDEKILQRQYLDTYFQDTLKLIDKIEKREDVILNQIEFSIDSKSDIEKAFRLIENYIYSYEASTTGKLINFFALEKERYLNTLRIEDFTKEYLDKLMIDANSYFDWKNNEFYLSEDCKLIVQINEWSDLNSVFADAIKPEENEKYFLLFRYNNKINTIRLNKFLYLILSQLSNLSSFTNILDNISQAFEIESGQDGVLEKKIKEQLILAYKSGVLKIKVEKKARSSSG